MVERPSSKVPEQSGKDEGGSSVQIPASSHIIDPDAAMMAASPSPINEYRRRAMEILEGMK